MRGVYPDASGKESAILMDIAAAQRALQRFGRVDRVLVKLPAESDLPAVAKANRRSVARGCGSASPGYRHKRKPENAEGVSMESAIAELYRPGCRRVPDIQHDFSFGGSKTA